MQISKSELVIEQRGECRRSGKIFGDCRAEETLAERALRIGVNQQHAVTLQGKGPGQVEASGTLSAASLLVDQANGGCHNVSAIWELPMAIPRKPLKSLSIRWHKPGKVAMEILRRCRDAVRRYPMRGTGWSGTMRATNVFRDFSQPNRIR